MLFRALSFVFIVLSATSAFNYVHSAEYVPVFMWGATAGVTHKTKALNKINGDKFEDILMEQLDSNPFTVVFIEETLSVEDFSIKDSKGRTPYPGLREKMTGESVMYYPFVSSALHTLNKLADPKKIDRIQLTDEGLSANIAPNAGQYLYISLKDARDGEDRLHMLSRHDEFMTEMFDKLLKSHDNVLAIYTARYPSWEIPSVVSRPKRHLLEITDWEAEATPANGFYNVNETIYIFASKIVFVDTANKTFILKEGKHEPLKVEEDNLGARLTFNKENETGEVQVDFLYYTARDGYWYMNLSVFETPEDNMTAIHLVFAPPGFSYHCSTNVTYKAEDGRNITLVDFQTQPFFEPPAEKRFSLAYDCVGFTTVPIWSGLFVVFLILIITSIGIIFMMDIRTMDRFDDPKGKTITITTTE